MRKRAAGLLFLVGLALSASGCGAPSASDQIYHFDSHTTPADREDVRGGVEAMQTWLLATGDMHLHQIAVFADADLDNLMAEYEFNEGIAANQDVIALAGWFASGGALARGRDIYIYLGPSWHTMPSADRKFLVAHEAFHVAQYGLVFDQLGSSPGAPPPRWLVEGSADYAAARALDAAGIRGYADSRADAAEEARGHALALDVVALPSDVHTGDASPYAEGFLATELLASKSGDRTLIDFWQDIGTEDGWVPAFQQTFGEQVASFVGRFETYRTETAPPFPGGISGHVVDPRGAGVWGVSVTVRLRPSLCGDVVRSTFDCRMARTGFGSARETAKAQSADN